MNFKKLILKVKEYDPEAITSIYEQEISARIRRKYTFDQELAILRQRDSKPEEFKEYNDYAEKCKAEVKNDLELSK